MKNTRKNYSIAILIIISQFVVSGQTDVNDSYSDFDAKSLRIAVIDGFTVKRVDLDNDGISDLTHGDMISRFLEESLPDAEIVKFDLQNPDDPVFIWRGIPGYQLEIMLRRIIADIENDRRYDAINISISHSETYDNEPEKKPRLSIFRLKKAAITSDIIRITPDNLLLRRNLIRAGLDNHTNNCITLIEQLITMGSRVYIAAGNQGKDAYNLLNLANGAINVGALTENGTKSAISGDNVLVNRWARSEFPVSKTEDGIDFTGDGKTDLSFEDLSAGGENLINKLIGGTSVATSIAIIEDFNVAFFGQRSQLDRCLSVKFIDKQKNNFKKFAN